MSAFGCRNWSRWNWPAIGPPVRAEARQHHAWLQLSGKGGGEARLCYLLNPLLPCSSKLMGGHWVIRLPELLQALEEAAGRVDRKQVRPVDGNIAAFIAARSERRLDNELMALAGGEADDAACMAQIRILTQLQSRHHKQALPGLAAWLAEQAGPVLATWRDRDSRASITERLQVLAHAGFLAPMLALVGDPVARDTDAREAQRASGELGRIDAELGQIAAGAGSRASLASRLGQEIAAGVGLATLAIVLAAVAFG
jgi:hypothetical protein